MKRFDVLVLVMSVMVFFFSGNSHAEPHDRLTPLLVDLAGWQAQPAQGMSMVSEQMKMISAHRAYANGEKKIIVNLMVNSGPLQESDLQEANSEDDVNRGRTRLLHGFWVKNTYSKKKNSGQLIVYLAYNQEANALIVANYTKMGDEQALVTLEKLNWAEIKGVVTSML